MPLTEFWNSLYGKKNAVVTLSAVLSALIIFGLIFLPSIAHELGHIVCARLLSTKTGEIKLDLGRIWLLRAEAVAVNVNADPYKLAMISLSGPLSSILVYLTAICLWKKLKHAPELAIRLGLFLMIVQLWAEVWMNLIPHRSGNLFSDGYLIFLALFGKYSAEKLARSSVITFMDTLTMLSAVLSWLTLSFLTPLIVFNELMNRLSKA